MQPYITPLLEEYRREVDQLSGEGFKFMKLKRLSALTLCLLLLIPGGCATKGVNLVENGTVTMSRATRDDGHFALISACAYQKGNALLVSARVRKLMNGRLPDSYDPYINVSLLAPDGVTVICRQAVRVLPLALRRREKELTVRLPCSPEKGSNVVLAFAPNGSGRSSQVTGERGVPSPNVQ